jgi:hypothetical protein
MSNTIKYKNEFGVEISIQQIHSIPNYRKMFLVNEILQKTEVYENHSLIKTIISVSNQTEINTQLQNDPNSFMEYIHEQNDYRITEYLDYENNIIVYKVVSVIQISTNNIICFKRYQTIDGILTPVYTEKKYYLPDGSEKYHFEYDSDGNAQIIYDEEFDEKKYGELIGSDPNEEFTWTGFEFYQFTEPTIPIN